MEKVITFRIMEEDKKLIQEKAKIVGLDTASFCRNLILKNLRKEDQQQNA